MNRSIPFSMLLAGIMAWLMFGEVSKGIADSQGAAESRLILRMLEETIDLGPFKRNEMTMKEFLVLLMEQYAAKGKDLPILVDNEAFKKKDRDFYIYDVIVRFPALKRMPGIEALRSALSRSDKPATFLIRRGVVVIVPKNQASTKELLKQTVAANFEGRPLNEALEELSAMTGASIVLDRRPGDKAKKPTPATLKSEVSLDAALRMLTDMADLKAVILGAGIYVTSPANAQTLRREWDKQ